MYTASINGTYKTKIYINFILFKIVRGWRTDHFAYSQTVTVPEVHIALAPIKNVPLAVSLDVTASGADFGLQVMSQNFPIEHVKFPIGAKPIHWEPIKGVVIDAIASFTQQAA